MSLMHQIPRACAVLAGLSLAGVILNGVLTIGNQRAEAEVQQRQQFINQTLQINQVSNALVQALATASVNGNDAAIKGLLAEFGISVSANDSAAGAKSAPKSP